MSRLSLVGSLAIALAACAPEPPDACKVLANDPLDDPFSHASYELAGRSDDQWRDDLTAKLLGAIDRPGELPEFTPPRLVSETSDGEEPKRLIYEIDSWVDGVPIPYAVLIPKSAQDPTTVAHVVVLLHGHGEDATSAFNPGSGMQNIGTILLEAGYIVVSAKLRSFGDFTIDGKNHEAYIAGLADGEFVGQVVSDTVQVGEAVVEGLVTVEGSTLTVLGHSFGGYIALHVGALVDGVDLTISSGHFTPYACVNTEFHHHGQDILEMEGVAELYDVVGMVAPESRVELFFGGRDKLFTQASRDSFARLEAIFEARGAAAQARMHVNPSIGHRVDPEGVLAVLPKP